MYSHSFQLDRCVPPPPVSVPAFAPPLTRMKRPAAAAVATADGIVPSIDWVNIDKVSAADVETLLDVMS